jgi:hypothetical protein
MLDLSLSDTNKAMTDFVAQNLAELLLTQAKSLPPGAETVIGKLKISFAVTVYTTIHIYLRMRF